MDDTSEADYEIFEKSCLSNLIFIEEISIVVSDGLKIACLQFQQPNSPKIEYWTLKPRDNFKFSALIRLQRSHSQDHVTRQFKDTTSGKIWKLMTSKGWYSKDRYFMYLVPLDDIILKAHNYYYIWKHGDLYKDKEFGILKQKCPTMQINEAYKPDDDTVIKMKLYQSIKKKKKTSSSSSSSSSSLDSASGKDSDEDDTINITTGDKSPIFKSRQTKTSNISSTNTTTTRKRPIQSVYTSSKDKNNNNNKNSDKHVDNDHKDNTEDTTNQSFVSNGKKERRKKMKTSHRHSSGDDDDSNDKKKKIRKESHHKKVDKKSETLDIVKDSKESLIDLPAEKFMEIRSKMIYDIIKPKINDLLHKTGFSILEICYLDIQYNSIVIKMLQNNPLIDVFVSHDPEKLEIVVKKF